MIIRRLSFNLGARGALASNIAVSKKYVWSSKSQKIFPTRMNLVEAYLHTRMTSDATLFQLDV